MSPIPSTGDAVTRRSLAQLDALPISLLDEPLDYIFADHFRQRCLCAVLQSFARTRRAPRAGADMVVAFLARETALHHLDEDADLFPALRDRAKPEDGLSPILARLSEDHRQAAPLITEMIAALSTQLTHGAIKIRAAAAEAMSIYAACEQRHLSVENGIVLVLARKRLKLADLAAMRAAMKARRMGAPDVAHP